ncbi:MAG: septum formation initiator family protein [Alphaproteobacteria bacterium]|jgi:cell division protein FtsB|nr:septum formation initiator family protein [Alphaproteobacteria bacterium]MDP6587886.1 septum formation initiator family protein [Alphaproteobacteria bacterium]MDP6817619.1 septum formation initiator family protein [Alphaproteobacteria bacterium]
MQHVIREIRKRARYLIAPLLGSLALVYLGYYGVQGDRGLLAWMQRGQEVAAAERNLAAERQQRDALAHRVAMLRPESLDLDLLDERVRAVLNLVKPNEIILMETPSAGWQ